MLWTEIESADDLQMYLEHKFELLGIDDTPTTRVSFLKGMSDSLAEDGYFNDKRFRVKQLVDSEISVLRVREHIDPMLF